MRSLGSCCLFFVVVTFLLLVAVDVSAADEAPARVEEPPGGVNASSPGVDAVPLGYRFKTKKQQQRCVDEPLGMESGDITDDQISVSSFVDAAHGKEYSRLNSENSWMLVAKGEQYLQVSEAGLRLVNSYK